MRANISTVPVVSVCIANYNGLEIIDDCITSVLAQKCGFEVEIIVFDDASTDGSALHVRNSYPNVRLIESQENVGFSTANNRMVETAAGGFVLLLNNDAALWPDALETLYMSAQYINGPAILSLPQYDFDSGELLDIGSLFDPFLNPVPNRNPERGEVAMVMGACLWITKSLWQELGGFPEWFGSLAEDLYLCCRARLAGHPVRAIGSSGYRHRVGVSFGGGKVRQGKLVTTRRRRALSERNKTFALIICYPRSLLVWLLPLHLAMIHLEGLLLSLAKCDIGVWNEIYAPLLPALWHQRQRLLALRRSVQLQRKASLGNWLGIHSLVPWKIRMLIRYGLPSFI
jgi:GT2 family glycosyltransferase